MGTYVLFYNKGDIVDIKEMGSVQKEMLYKCYHGKTESLQCHPACNGHGCKQIKGKILAKRINVHIEHIKHSKSQGNFLKHVKKNDQKRRKPKRKLPVFN